MSGPRAAWREWRAPRPGAEESGAQWCRASPSCPGTARTAPSTGPCSVCTIRSARQTSESCSLNLIQDWDQAYQLIDITRDMLDTELTALSAESYQRAYPIMVQLQMLAELEEAIEYKQVPERRQTINEMWWSRLQGCQRVVEDWQRILQVRSLVLEPADHQRTWLKYASLCRKSHRLKLSHKTLVTILGSDPSLNPDQPLPTAIPQV